MSQPLVHILTASGVIGGLGSVLAVLLVVADALFANYGECKITINGERELDVEGGSSLLASLMSADVFIPSACGGRGSCGLCKLKVTEGGGPVLPTEEPHLTPSEIGDRFRLSCQLKVRGDMAILIPEELFAIKRYRGVCERLEDLTHDIKLVRIRLVEPETIAFKPGQYVQLEAPAYGDNPEPVYRAYSIASPPSADDSIELVIRLVPGGICTTWVFTVLREGDEVFFSGPYGEFCLRDTERDAVFIAGGSGLAPIRSILKSMAEEKSLRRATFYFGALTERDLFFTDELTQLEHELPNFRFVPALSAQDNHWDGERGLITEVVSRREDALSGKEAYLCGSPGMIDACIKVLRQKQLPEDRAYYDKFE